MISFYYSPDFCAGSFRSQSLVNALLKNKKFKKIIVFTTQPQRYGHMKNIKKIEKHNNLVIYRFYTPEHNNKFYKQCICYLFFFIKCIIYGIKNSKNIDGIFATSSRFGTAFLGFLMSIFLRKNYALDIRDVFSDNLQSLKFSKNWFGSTIIKIFSNLEKMIVKKTKWLNFVSPGFYNYTHLNPKNKSISLFTNGIDEIFIKNRNSRKNFSPHPFSDPLIITYAGNIGYGQGLEKTVIKIAKHFKNKIQFKLIGDGSSVKLIKNEISNYNLSNILILKPVKRFELLKFYNESDILFLQLNNVSAFENVLPSKIFDYGSFEKPILAGVSGVAKDFLCKNLPHSYIYDPDNYDEAINMINKIINNQNIRINNNKFVEDFNREQIMEKMVNSFYPDLFQ